MAGEPAQSSFGNELRSAPDSQATGFSIPLLGNATLHEQQNWMADFADRSKLAPRAVPWTLPAYLTPLGGANPARIRVWHTFGVEMGLYSRLPHFGPDGISKPWSPQVGDQFQAIVADLKKNPLPDGPRGIAIVTPYGTAIDHPFYQPDGVTVIPRAPTWLWGQHDGVVLLLYGDGSTYSAGQIPGVRTMHDWCVDETNRKIIYACELGAEDSADATGATWNGGKVVKVDRATGAGTAAAPEDATKYVTTDFLTGLTYPTGVCTDEQANVYIADFGAGKVYRNQSLWTQIPPALGRPFCCRYDDGSVHILTDALALVAIDCASGALTTVCGAQAESFAPGAAFLTLSIDRNGTFDRKGNFAICHSHANQNLGTYIYDGTKFQTMQAKYGVGIGYMKCGDLLYQQEPYAHYPWGFAYHRWQARVISGGFTSMPHELVAYRTATEVPAEEAEPDAQAHGYMCAARAMEIIRKGGSIGSPFDKPSLTCLMSREGWSPFAGCSADEIAEMAFDDAEAWIRGGLIGSFRRDDLLPWEMYCLLVYLYRQSQRFLLEGGALTASLGSWWVAKYGAVPAVPAGVRYTPDPARYLVPRKLQGGAWGVEVQDEGGTSLTTAPPASYRIVIDEGLPTQQDLAPGAFVPRGQHSLTAKTDGIAQRAVAVGYRIT